MPPTPRKKPHPQSGKPRARRGVKLKPTQMRAADLAITDPDARTRALIEEVESTGGKILAVYREPLGGHIQLFAALPIDQVQPTDFQRDVSDAHVRKLTIAMDKTKRFLDPIIAVRMGDKYLTPNGNHRLTALLELDAKTILALLVPDTEVLYQILALNIEKAHNLREKAIEVLRMYRELAETQGDRKEKAFALEFEEPQLITLGFAYEARPRISGGAYQSTLKKVDAYWDIPLAKALERRQRRAELLLKLDDAVSETVTRLKARGLVSPYLKSFVVARINPLRFIKGDLPTFESLMETMTKRAKGMNADRIRSDDLSRSGGAPDEE